MVVASLSDSITTTVAHHGVYAVFGLMALDAVFPAASELVMLYAGALAAGAFTGSVGQILPQPGISFFGSHIGYGGKAFIVMALAGTLGYLVGALVGWAIGRYGGRPLLERHGRWFHLSPAKLDKAEAWFTRWGNLGVALGRITPIVRSFVSIPAGVFEMRLGPYTVLTAIGSAIWAFALAGTLGYFAGSLIGWAIGRYGGRPLLERRGRWFHLTPEKLDRAERWFVKWGNFGVLVGRVTPVVRSFVSIPAGVFRMPLAPYSLFTIVGSAVWAFVIAGVGYGLGTRYNKFHHSFRYAEYAIVAGVLLGAAYLIYRWSKAARVSRRADPAD